MHARSATGSAPRAHAPWLTWLALAAAYAIVVALMFLDAWRRDLFVGWDALNEYWPDLIYQRSAYADGELPLWNPYTLGGYAFHADPQTGILTPINWICMLVSLVAGPSPWLVQLKVMLLFYACLWGMHLVVWRWTRSHAAAAVAALTFVLGAPLLVHKNSALPWPLLQLPWALLAIDAFLAHASLRRAILLGFALALVGTSHPQGAFYSVLILGPYAAVRLLGIGEHAYRARATTPVRAALRREARRLAPGAAVAVAIAGAWLALVYLPAWSTVDGSARAHRPLSWALNQPLEPRALNELFVPGLDTNWMHDIYLGPLAVVLLLWLAVVRREGRLWLVLALVSIALALSTHAHLLPWLAEHVPGFGVFRLPYRYKLVTGFAAAAGVGLAIGVIARAELRRWQAWLAIALGVTWSLVALAWTGRWPTVWALLALGVLAGGLLDRARRRYWLAALVLVVGVDLFRAAELKLSILQPRPAIDAGGALLARMPGIDRTWRFRDAHAGGVASAIPYHAAFVHEVRELTGYPHPLAPRRTLDVLARGRKEPLLLTHFNVKYFVGGASPPGAIRVAGTALAIAPDVAPVARLYPRAETLPSRRMLDRLAQVAPSAREEALIDPAEAPPALPASTFAPVDGTVVAFERARLVVEIDAPADGILVVNESWAPGWRATVDGAPAPVFRADYMLRALVVPTGHHRIELWFAAPAYRAGVVVGALVLAILLVLCAAPWPWLTRAPGGDPPRSLVDGADRADGAEA